MKLPNGFTLIEMMVVIGIIGVLSVGAVASYNRMNDRAKVEETAKTIAEELLSVQKDAKSGAGVVHCSSGEKFSGMQVKWDAVAEIFTVWALCDGTATDTGKTIPENSGPDGPVPQLVDVSVSPAIINFASLTGGATAAAITVEGSITRTINITGAGGISVN